jgi:murein DD-endopeptidase MepM/ murein hydrolase activator NlpD
MLLTASSTISNRFARLRTLFSNRDVILHDGRAIRRFTVPARTQALVAAAGAMTVVFSAYGVSQAAVTAFQATGVAGAPASTEGKLVRMRAQVATMRADVAAMKLAARAHAARVEARQTLLAAVLSGKVDPDKLALSVPAAAIKTRATASVVAPFRRVEARQLALAVQARAATEAQYAETARHLRRLGVRPERFARTVQGGMGGPFEAVEPAGAANPEAASDAQFRSLFTAWKKLDTLEQAAIAIPSAQPVDMLTFTSNFGVRSDPFRGTAAMHAGVDIPGPIGTPIYATADGIIARAERSGGYGNLVEVNHGKGIETRYGHLSRIIVAPNARVKRGQLIGLMGSTGRSTGSHLHYEVRIDGRAVNPVPFLTTGDMMIAMKDRALKSQQVAMGGPVSR